MAATTTAPKHSVARPEGTAHVRRIAITVDPEIPVPPVLYGGIERIVAQLVEHLADWGVEVLLFAHPESQSPVTRLAAYPALQSNGPWNTVRNTGYVTAQVLAARPQLVHSFGRLAYLLPLLPLPLPKVMSYQREISAGSIEQGEKLARGTLHFTACSRNLMARYADRPNWSAIHNSVPPSAYDFQSSVAADAPLMFLGRVEEIKGPHLAIQIAQRTGRRLILAGNRPAGEHHDLFYREHIEPHLDGRQIHYVGPVNDAQKNELLGQSAALLMPVLWEEPFGIVMAEALACGTPVIGLRRGAVPEVVEHGRNGFVGDTADDLVQAVRRLSDLARIDCRADMEQRFSSGKMASEYLRLYARLIAPGHTAA